MFSLSLPPTPRSLDYLTKSSTTSQTITTTSTAKVYLGGYGMVGSPASMKLNQAFIDTLLPLMQAASEDRYDAVRARAFLVPVSNPLHRALPLPRRCPLAALFSTATRVPTRARIIMFMAPPASASVCMVLVGRPPLRPGCTRRTCWPPWWTTLAPTTSRRSGGAAWVSAQASVAMRREGPGSQARVVCVGLPARAFWKSRQVESVHRL